MVSHTRLDVTPDASNPLRYSISVDLQAFDVDNVVPATITALRTAQGSLRVLNGSATLGTQRYATRSLGCDPASTAPSSYDALMLFDRSGSMADNDPRDDSRAAARAFIARLGSSDRAQIAEFTGSITGGVNFLTPAFTGDAVQLGAAIDAIRAPFGGTPLWDAMQKSLGRFGASASGRALLTFSDGEDTNSQATPSAVQQAAIAAGVAVYAINLRNANSAALDRLALATGGAVFSTQEAQQLIQYYQVLGLLLSRRAVSCRLEIDVSFEPSAGAGEVGYGPAYGVRPAITFDVRSNHGASTSTWEPNLPLYPGRRIGTSSSGKPVYETDGSSATATNCIDTTNNAAIRNGCSSPVQLTVCTGVGLCSETVLAGGQSIGKPSTTYRYVACNWQQPLDQYRAAQVSGTAPDLYYVPWQDPGVGFQCINNARF